MDRKGDPMRKVFIAAVLMAGVASAKGEQKTKAHPHFNDGGTLRWYTKLADAQKVAKKEGKLIFIEYGRKL